MSSKWVSRMHGLLPLNLQEEHVKEILEEYHLVYRAHEVFPIGARSQVADFYLPERNLIIECWLSRSRRGIALTWVERNAAFVDLKFRRLKECYPGIRCLGLVQVPRVDVDSLKGVVAPLMAHVDMMAYSMEEMWDALMGVLVEGVPDGQNGGQ